MLHFLWYRYTFLFHVQGWSESRATSLASARTRNILVFPPHSSPRCQQLRFPSCSLWSSSHCSEISLPGSQPSHTFERPPGYIWVETREFSVCIPVLGESPRGEWFGNPTHGTLPCGLLIDVVCLAHSHLNWDVVSHFYFFTTCCSVSSRKVFIGERAHKEEKDKYLIKDFMNWKNRFIILALERDVKVTEDLS